MIVFFSYSRLDSEIYKIPEIAEKLERYPEISEVLYYEGANYKNIIKFMNDNLSKSDVIITFFSKNALQSKYVEMEWQAALASRSKIVIPVFENFEEVPILLKSHLGIQFNNNLFNESVSEIYNIIVKTHDLKPEKVSVKNKGDYWQFSMKNHFPFEVNNEMIKFCAIFKDLDENQVIEQIKLWMIKNIKYSIPVAREYQSSSEIFKSRKGCAGEICNLIIALLRYNNIASGILEIKTINNIAINHVAVGITLENQNYLIDLTLSSIAMDNAEKFPIPDERWIEMISHWRAPLEAPDLEKINELKSKDPNWKMI